MSISICTTHTQQNVAHRSMSYVTCCVYSVCTIFDFTARLEWCERTKHGQTFSWVHFFILYRNDVWGILLYLCGMVVYVYLHIRILCSYLFCAVMVYLCLLTDSDMDGDSALRIGVRAVTAMVVPIVIFTFNLKLLAMKVQHRYIPYTFEKVL